MAVPASPPPPGTSALVIGAAVLLLGNAMMMVTRWPTYNVKNRRAWMKKWGSRISFLGALAAVWGAAKPIWESGKYPVVSGVLFAVAVAMGGLLVAPLILPDPADVEEPTAKEPPSDERHGENGAAVAGGAGSDPEINVESATEGEADLGEPPKAHPKAGQSR